MIDFSNIFSNNQHTAEITLTFQKDDVELLKTICEYLETKNKMNNLKKKILEMMEAKEWVYR